MKQGVAFAVVAFAIGIGNLLPGSVAEVDSSFHQFLSSVHVVSGGFKAGPRVLISVAGESYLDIAGEEGRGLNVIAFHNGTVVLFEQFDFYAEADASQRLSKAIDGLPDGAFVVMAVCDDASSNFDRKARLAIKKVGGQSDLSQNFRWSYYLIGRKGLKPGEAVEAWGPGEMIHEPGSPTD